MTDVNENCDMPPAMADAWAAVYIDIAERIEADEPKGAEYGASAPDSDGGSSIED
jgi:hypothetical protein